MMKNVVLVAVFLCSMPSMAQTKPVAGKMVIGLEKIKSFEGQFCVSIYDKEVGFPGVAANAVRSLCQTLEAGKSSIGLESVPFGSYAVAVFHDSNSDGILNTGLFGIPKESFGFSNNPGITVGAPKYAKCAFSFGESSQMVKIDLMNIL